MWNWGKKLEENNKNEEINFQSLGFDFDNIGIIDESQIEVSESDLNDPNLLSELNNLHHFDDNDNEEDDDENEHEHEHERNNNNINNMNNKGKSQQVQQIQFQVEDLLCFDELETTNNNNNNHNSNNQLKFNETENFTNDKEITTLKLKAVALKKEGKKAEAVEIMKQIKLLQSQQDLLQLDETNKTNQKKLNQGNVNNQSSIQAVQQTKPVKPIKSAQVKSSSSSTTTTTTTTSSTQIQIKDPVKQPMINQKINNTEQQQQQSMNKVSTSKSSLSTTTISSTSPSTYPIMSTPPATIPAISPTMAMTSTRPSSSSSFSSLSTLSTQYDAFTPLENAINEAMRTLLHEAKEYKDKNPQLAAEKYRKYKVLKEELLVIASRRNFVGVLPPLFSWKTITKEKIIEDITLSDDEIKVSIVSIKNIESILQTHSSKNISIKYSVGIIKDSTSSTSSSSSNATATTEYTTKQIKYKSNEKIGEINEDSVYQFRRKGSTIESQFSRKKANFEVILHRGMFQSNIVIGTIKINLNGLLTKCKIGGELPLMDLNGRKAVGGVLEVYLSLRRPISSPEVEIETERELIIGEWPTVLEGPMTIVQQPIQIDNNSNNNNNNNSMLTTSSIQSIDSSNGMMNNNQTTTSTSESIVTSKPILTADFSSLTELEKEDPLNVNFIVSNDVLEATITETENEIRLSRDPEEKSDLQLKLSLLQAKLAMLVRAVQSESITIEEYINLLKDRVNADKPLAVYCNQTNRKTEAIKIMKRIKIMQNEIKSAEEVPEDS